MRTSLRNQKGAVLVLTLMVIFILIVLGSSFILRAIAEWSTALRESRLAQATVIGEGATAVGIEKLDQLINTYMLNTINVTSPQAIRTKAIQYVAAKDGLSFLVLYVLKKNDDGTTTALLTKSGTQATYTEPTTALGNGTHGFTLVITQKSDPLTVTNDPNDFACSTTNPCWDFPFFFQVRAQGQVASITSNASLFGDFTVRVKLDNFARYALFTNTHTMADGTTVWFWDQTIFSGPMHTNTQFAFAGDPVLSGVLTQHLSQALFYNNGSNPPKSLDANTNPPRDVPVYSGTYTRGVSTLSTASSVQQTSIKNEARASDTTSGNGVFLANSSGVLTGGIYVNGDAGISLSTSGNNPIYTISQGSAATTVTVNYSANTTTVGGSSWNSGTNYAINNYATYNSVNYRCIKAHSNKRPPNDTYWIVQPVLNGIPDGVDNVGTIIYVDGQVSQLSGTVQKNTELTVSASNDVLITGNLVYEDYNPAQGTLGQPDYVPPNADDKTNLLGIVSWGGDVRVATSAPSDVNIHAVIMATASNGEFKVDNYNSRDASGTATLLGGAITQYYGAFNTFDSNRNLVTGYGRNFVYDGRMQLGNSPPYFPSMNTLIAFTNDITDKITYREGSF